MNPKLSLRPAPRGFVIMGKDSSGRPVQRSITSEQAARILKDARKGRNIIIEDVK